MTRDLSVFHGKFHYRMQCENKSVVIDMATDYVRECFGVFIGLLGNFFLNVHNLQMFV